MNQHHFATRRVTSDARLWMGTLILGVICLSLYFPATDRWVAGDDMRNQIWATQNGFNILLNEDRFFRPIENLVNATNTWVLGPDNNSINFLVALLGLITSAHLIMRIARRIYPASPVFPFLAGGYFALNSLPVSTVIQIDTICQQYATVFGLATCYWLISRNDRSSLIYSGVGTLLLGLALFSKESSIGVVGAMPIAALLLRDSGSPKDWRSGPTLIRWAGMCLIPLVVYAIARAAVGAAGWGSQGSGNAAFIVDPVHWLKQVMILVGPVFYIGSTLDLFPLKSTARISFSLLLTLVALIPALIGLASWLKEWPKRDSDEADHFWAPVGLTMLMLSSLFPVLLLAHRSETWTYGPLPYGCLLFGIFISRGWERMAMGQRGKALTVSAVVFCTIAAIWLAYGVREKVTLSVEVASTSRRLFIEADQVIASSDSTDLVFCVDDDVNANGRRLRSSEVGDVAVQQMLANKAHYNIFYDSPMEVLHYLQQYLSAIHGTKRIEVSEEEGCLRLNPLRDEA